MDPQMLIDHAAAAGVPAPYWFVVFFKVLGFTLHMIPMNLWFGGLLVALGLHWWGNEHGRRFAGRFLKQMPVLVAIGINLGVVPLLFIQVAYNRAFYPATILMAWFWLGIIALLIPAYYGVYVYAWGMYKKNSADKKQEPAALPAWKQLAGWLSALLFLVISFLFANGMSLMDHIDRWPALWNNNQMAGAALGTALNVGDATLWPRWLLMFGLALGTTAVWVLVDAAWLFTDASEAYRQWAWRFARKLYTVGMVWAAAAGTWYVFGSWSPELRAAMFQFPTLILTGLTAVAAGLPWLLLMKFNETTAKLGAAAVALAQVGVLAINAISRQVVQNINLKPFVDVANQPTNVEWGPLVMFLVVFVLGVGVIAWMLQQTIAAVRAGKA